MMAYLGARDVSVPWTTAETHSAPKCAFQNGTEQGSVSERYYNKQIVRHTAGLDASVLCD